MINWIVEFTKAGLDIHFNDHLVVIILLNLFFLGASYTDIKEMKIYNKFNWTMLYTRIAMLLVFIKYQEVFMQQYIMGGAVMFLSFLLVGMFSKTKMGGDIKFAGNMGLWLGFNVSIVLVAILIIINLIYRVFTGKSGRVPLAPFFYASYLILTCLYFFL